MQIPPVQGLLAGCPFVQLPCDELVEIPMGQCNWDQVSAFYVPAVLEP